MRDIQATLYQTLGIDVGSQTVEDPFGRPMPLLDGEHTPVKELVG